VTIAGGQPRRAAADIKNNSNYKSLNRSQWANLSKPCWFQSISTPSLTMA